MNSSTGFKKRSLLRPPSGLLSNAREFLRVVDISQSEPIIASNIRTQVAVIQQQINVLDKDKRIRTGQSSLQKTYVLNLKKWLRDAQAVIEKEDDDAKILKQMGVDSFEAGFRKLWKVTNNLDLIISKITELQVVQFLKYDEMFEGLSSDSNNGQRILQAISKGGFAPSSFHLSQIALQREIGLFQLVSQLKRSNITSQSVSSSKGFMKPRDDTAELIEQLRSDNKKLVDLLESIQKQEKEKAKNQPKQPVKIQSSRSITSTTPKGVFAQLEDKYKIQISDLNNRINRLNQELTESKIQCTQYQARLKAAEDQLKGKQFSLAKKPAAGTYEEALLQEMDKMKKGFEKKIQKILDEFATKERQMRKKQYEYKNQNDKIKWEKGLLLKKFEALAA